MMESGAFRVGIVACSGVDCLGGVIARMAAGKVISELRPGQTVGQCLPLFLTGNMKEQEFARIYPTITVEGCSQACACGVVEKYSGKVIVSASVPDVLGSEIAALPAATEAVVASTYAEKVNAVISDVTAKVDGLLAMLARMTGEKSKHTCNCGCGSADSKNCDCSNGCNCI
ncbi:putative zinc-binding protein [Sporomusa malonica]|uniref:DGC domain-containing protein n=1 Tax=Sporomusa malonica TaxID=112901 RepID=A0A1W1YFK0_9FIRM|nr:putative zinc-binding protein [Sporomusa malonica]SMC34904.1 DGC domain-containing protein [Sporomusa malonica]